MVLRIGRGCIIVGIYHLLFSTGNWFFLWCLYFFVCCLYLCIPLLFIASFISFLFMYYIIYWFTFTHRAAVDLGALELKLYDQCLRSPKCIGHVGILFCWLTVGSFYSLLMVRVYCGRKSFSELVLFLFLANLIFSRNEIG